MITEFRIDVILESSCKNIVDFSVKIVDIIYTYVKIYIITVILHYLCIKMNI